MKRQVVRLVATWAFIGLPAMFLVFYVVSSSVAQDDNLFDSPISTPPVPQPTPLPSAEAQVALRYVAEQYDIPLEHLVVVNEHRREYAELRRTFQAFTLLDVVGDRFFDLLVDLADQSVVEDVAAIQQAEEDAHKGQYGKLEPALHQRLEAAADDELIEVAIWIAGRPRQTQEEMFAELAARYPEARAAMDQMGKPFDVQDDELRAEIQHVYSAMVTANAQPSVQPMVDFLQAQGYVCTTYDGLPSITAELPKHFILSLAERTDVGQIYLIEGEGSLLLDSAIATARVPAVWQRGYDGTGVSVAVVEPDNVDFWSTPAECPPGTSNCFRHPGQSRPGVGGLGNHGTLVASAIASNHSTFRGMAPDTTIHSAGMGSDNEAGLVEAVRWALAAPPNGVEADIVNVSWGKGVQRGMRWSDRSVDHWARHCVRLIVAAAGNQEDCGLYLCSPAKGWNVLSVGAYDDVNNPNWSDDAMASFSSYINPSTSQDREKPEIVAPGVQITGIARYANLYTSSGTSFAAPQVAGLAALLIDRHQNLAPWPEAIRAIIMASSVHNIEGPAGIPTGQDLKDGAGGIDAALADLTAKTRWTSATSPCTDPCWWGIDIDNSSFPVGT